MIQLVIWIIVAGLLVWAATAVIAVLPVAEPFKRVATVLVIAIAVLWLISAVTTFFGYSAMPWGAPPGHRLR